ncbi:phospholipase D-like domain-containing protein [Oleiharenicola lentus]|uniref:phospholipase D-like domain-containing protein n=1 Tax=Oleiharenicola lentus TaxID=2508720 RepID=UPI003F669AE3
MKTNPAPSFFKRIVTAPANWWHEFRARRSRRKSAATREKSSGKDEGISKWWISLGALAVGLGLLFWATSARMLSEPVEVDYGPETAIFRDTLGPLLSSEFTWGNRIETLANGDGFFPPMLQAIREAKKTITLESYIWESGIISDQFIAALTERARAGVKVHVMVDGMGVLKFKDADQRRLLDAGVEYVAYGREHWWEVKYNINHHTHRKLLIVDGKVGFTGGMCIGDAWLGNATSPEHWRETQLKLEGPVVRQMQAVFATNWIQTTGRLLVGPDYFQSIPHSAEPAGTVALCYKSGPDEDPENARISYLLAIASARKSIKIAHAYFVPDDLAINMLIAARDRGVEIDVVVPAINDSKFGRAASRSRWGKLLAKGVKFHLYEPAMYHCKTMIVDDVFMTIGSTNFDNRSFRINDEVNVNILDRAVVRDNLQLFDSDVKHSRPLTLDEFATRAWYIKLADHFCGLFRSQF